MVERTPPRIIVEPPTPAPSPKPRYRVVEVKEKWNKALAEKVDRKARKLQADRWNWMETTVKVPGTNIVFQANIPTSKELQKPEYDAKDAREAMLRWAKPKKVGLWKRFKTFVTPITYPARQLMAYIIVQVYLLLTFGTGKDTSFYRVMKFRYPPTPDGWDLFEIRDFVEQCMRGHYAPETALDIQEMGKIRKRIQWNYNLGDYEVVTYNNFYDPNPGQDRYPGETEGIDPEEYEKYLGMSGEQIIVYWLGEKVIAPMMLAFEFAVRGWWIFFWFSVGLALTGSLLFWIAKWVDILLYLDEDGLRQLFWHFVYWLFEMDEDRWSRVVRWYTQKYMTVAQLLKGQF